jgi:o-succinylbenzoate synthase
MLKATYKKCNLIFRQPAGTSSGILTEKTSWFIFVFDDLNPDIKGTGEAGLLKGLSIDDRTDFEDSLAGVCNNIVHFIDKPDELTKLPSIRFALETALLDLRQGGRKILFPSDFTKGLDSLAINGLIWMGTFDAMKKQIREKIKAGFSCIKLKIGAINFEDEINLIRNIRNRFSPSDIEIRLDANGAFGMNEVTEKLKKLADFHIHSIEQPIKQNNWNEMAELCRTSPVPIALDEELIGVKDFERKRQLLEEIQPQYIVLKPSLLGGFKVSEEWMKLAAERKIGWWITSALESNIGLNAIAQWTYTLGNKIPQGLGTGQLYVNNIHSPIKISTSRLFFDPKQHWEIPKVLE